MKRIERTAILLFGSIAAAAPSGVPGSAAAAWKPVSLPHTVRDQGVAYTLLELRQGGSREEPGVRAQLRVAGGGKAENDWRPAALRVHTMGKPVLEPPTIFTVPGPNLDLRFHGAIPPSEKLARLEIEFRRRDGFPRDRTAEFFNLMLPRRVDPIETQSRNTALGRIEIRMAPSLIRSPRAGDPTGYLEVVVKPAPRPRKAAQAGVRPGKLHLTLVRAHVGFQPIPQLHGQVVTVADTPDKYLFPFTVAPGQRQISVVVALDRGRSLLFPPVRVQRSQ